jgi:hypothetical protein
MVVQGLREVFTRGRYILLAATTGLAVFVLATWLPNLGLVWKIAASGSIPLDDKLKVLTALVGSIGTNFTVVSALTTVLIAALFGANVAMIAYYFRLRRQHARQAGQAAAATSLGGAASGLFGVGCAACGTFVLSPALAALGAGGLIALLPFGGEEFGLLGVGMLGLSLVLTARKIGQPAACAMGISGRTERHRPGKRPNRLFRALAFGVGETANSEDKVAANKVIER